MKKMKKWIILLLIPLFFCACDKKEGQLIELNSNEVLNALVKEQDIVFCTINFQSDKGQEFKDNLEKIVKKLKIKVYYIDGEHLMAQDIITLGDTYQIDYYNNTYNVFINGEFVIDKEYNNYETLYKDLNGKDFEIEVEDISEDKVNSNLENAKKAYEEGKISTSFNYLSNIWKKQEAKDFYLEYDKLNLVREWENYELLKDGMAMYTGIYIYSFADYAYIVTKKDKFDGFKLPNLDEYERYNYKVIDDVFYISKDDKKYQEYAKIKYIDGKQMTLEKKGKNYTFLRVN